MSKQFKLRSLFVMKKRPGKARRARERGEREVACDGGSGDALDGRGHRRGLDRSRRAADGEARAA